jgi:PAS domain S-box-containing protein
VQETIVDLKSVFTTLPGSNVLVLPDSPVFTIVAVSQDYLQATGRTTGELIGKGLFEAFPNNPDDPHQTSEKTVRASLEYALKHKEPHYLPVQRYDVSNPDGSFIERYWSADNKPVLNELGEVIYLIHSAEDVTEKLKTEQKQAQLKSIEKTFSLFMHAPMVVGLVTGDDYLLEMANEAAFKLWGKGPEMIGKPILHGLPELEGQGVIERFDQVRTSGQPYFANEVPITSFVDGKEEQHYFNLVYQPYYGEESRQPTGVFTISYDVTEQVKARQKAQESEEKYHGLFESMEQAFCIIEVLFDTNKQAQDYRFLETNPVFEKQTGLKDAVGKTARELVPDLESHWVEFYGKVAITGKSLSFHDESKAMNRWFEVNAFKIGSSNSSKVAILFSDITERKQVEEAIKQSESNLRNTILQAPVAIGILKGPSFVVEIANDAMYELWGRSKEELQGKSIFVGLPEVKDQGYEELLTGVYTTAERFSAQGIPVTLPRNGRVETVYINLLYEAFREADGRVSGVIAVATDVTDQVVARMKVEESNKDFQFVTDFMPQMIWVTRPDGYHYYYNKQWYDFTGLTYGETEGEGWNGVFHPDDQQRAWQLWRHSLATGEPYEIEYRCRRYDGQYRWVLGRALPLKDESGTILKWFGTCTDIHDQKIEAQLLEEKVKERTEELQKANQELKRSNKNLEEFAYAASHDLKEPTRKIHVFAERLKDSLGDRLQESEKQYFQRMELASKRMSTLIDDLLTYSEVSQKATLEQEVDLNFIIDCVLSDLDLEIEQKRATIQVSKLFHMTGHRRQLQQAFQNLISNALKYSKPEVAPVISITCGKIKGSDTGLHFTTEQQAKEFYQVMVKDNGIGFEQEDAERIFNVFTRLHGMAEYKGTGVGLSIVRKVIENHHGYIWAESQPSEGATFKILLPSK